MGQKPFYILTDENPFRRYWSLLIIILMIYVAIWVPYMICMLPENLDEEPLWYETLDKIVDFFFMIDIIINFLSAYDDP